MKKVFFIVLAVFYFSLKSYGEENSLNRIVAIVNDEIITKNELERKKAFLIYQIRQSGKEIDKEEENKLDKALIDKLIINKLIRNKAKEESITVTEAEIEERIKKVKERFPNEDSFRDSLKEAGLTIEDLKEAFEYEIILQKLFFNKVRNKIVITPQEIEEFYRRHQERFREPDRVRLRNIFIYKYNRSPEEIKERLDEIVKLLQEDIPFEEVAKKYSEGATALKGGVMGEIKRGELSSSIEEIIFSLKPGELSQWIETESGFYLFRVDEYIPGKILNFEEVQIEINNILFRQKIDEKFNKWVSELKEKAFIQINE